MTGDIPDVRQFPALVFNKGYLYCFGGMIPVDEFNSINYS